MTFFLSFFLGLFSTAFLFIISCVLVTGTKTLLFAIKKFLNKTQPQPAPPIKEPAQKKPKIVKSIEIDPAIVDKIYVKKSS